MLTMVDCDPLIAIVCAMLAGIAGGALIWTTQMEKRRARKIQRKIQQADSPLRGWRGLNVISPPGESRHREIIARISPELRATMEGHLGMSLEDVTYDENLQALIDSFQIHHQVHHAHPNQPQDCRMKVENLIVDHGTGQPRRDHQGRFCKR